MAAIGLVFMLTAAAAPSAARSVAPSRAVDPSWVNLALGKPVTASSTYPGNPAKLAVDGDWLTYWSSGGFPAQWIEVDLGSVETVDEIELGVTQLPDSFTVHYVYGRDDPSQPWTLLHTFAGYTVDQQELQYDFATPQSLRYLMVETTQSRSWVGWREIDVWGPPSPKLYDFVVTHKRPVAGRRFTGVVVVNRNPQATIITRVLCDAEVAKRRLHGRQQRFYSPGTENVTAVACSWHVPAAASGKQLRIWGYPFGRRVRVFDDAGTATDSDPLSWVVKR
ncbi:MAG TPA: discoidin domain-containing protein [Gaiellaceae bacterium]|nr:discoidin domain-containing protein [Gaiellaceae bacterium]